MAIKKTLSPQASDILRTNPHIRVRLENSGIIAGRILLAQLPTINARVLSGLRTIENFSLDKTIHAQALGNLIEVGKANQPYVARPRLRTAVETLESISPTLSSQCQALLDLLTTQEEAYPTPIGRSDLRAEDLAIQPAPAALGLAGRAEGDTTRESTVLMTGPGALLLEEEPADRSEDVTVMATGPGALENEEPSAIVMLGEDSIAGQVYGPQETNTDVDEDTDDTSSPIQQFPIAAAATGKSVLGWAAFLLVLPLRALWSYLVHGKITR